MAVGKGQFQTAQLLKAELLRRLSRFEDAEKYLKGLQKSGAFKDAFLKDIIKYQISLCEQKDAKPHAVSEAAQ